MEIVFFAGSYNGVASSSNIETTYTVATTSVVKMAGTIGKLKYQYNSHITKYIHVLFQENG